MDIRTGTISYGYPCKNRGYPCEHICMDSRSGKPSLTRRGWELLTMCTYTFAACRLETYWVIIKFHCGHYGSNTTQLRFYPLSFRAIYCAILLILRKNYRYFIIARLTYSLASPVPFCCQGFLSSTRWCVMPINNVEFDISMQKGNKWKSLVL